MLTRVDDYRFTSHGSSHAPPRRGGRVRTYKGAYISITSLCNTDVCAYCYARDQKIAMRTMPLDLFSRTLDMLQEISDFPEVYLVGGEPTVLRDLPAYLHEIERRGWTTTIYTNGSFKERQLEVLRGSAAVSRVSFHFDEFLFQRYAWLASRWDRNLRALSDHCEVSIIGVIDGPGFPFLELVDRAASYGASFTWIFATPTSGNTPYLGLHEMRALGPTVQQMLLRAMERNVKCSPDLPIPLCIFDPAFLNEHAERFALVRRCQPFAYFHVDGRVSYCTAMPVFTAPRPATSDQLVDIIEQHREQDRVLKQRPSFPECVTCEEHLAMRCQGGCMTYKVYAKQRQDEQSVNLIRPAAPTHKAAPY